MRTLAPIALLVLAACDAGDAGEACQTGADCERNCISQASEGQEAGDHVELGYCQGDENIPICWNVIEDGKIESTFCT